MSNPIKRYMTRSVQMVGTQRTLADAHQIMNEHGIRHLPVMEAGRLVGMLSQRDLHLVETLKDVDPKAVTVEEAMSQDAYAVDPESPLSEVARAMARHKYGSAVVVQDGRVLGIFTTTDALKVLGKLLPEKPARKAKAPSRVARKAPSRATGKAAARARAPRR